MINKQTNKQMIKEDLKFGCFYTPPPGPPQVQVGMMQDQTNKVNLLYGLGPASGW